MKTNFIYLLTIVAIACANTLSAQVGPNTNPYPVNGNIGFGYTNTIGYKLTTHGNMQGNAYEDPETGEFIIVQGTTPFRIIGKTSNPNSEGLNFSTKYLSEAFTYEYFQEIEEMKRVYSLDQEGSMLLGISSNTNPNYSFSYSLVSDNTIYTKKHLLVDDKIGIGTTNPLASIDLRNGSIALNSNKLNLVGAADGNHFLSFVYDFGANNDRIDGPQLMGYDGGMLGTTNGTDKGVLFWNKDGKVGINTLSPQKSFHVEGTTVLRNIATEAARSNTSSTYTYSTNSGTLLELANGDMIIGGGLSNNKFVFHMQYWNANADELIIAPIVNGSYDWGKSLKVVNDGRLVKNVSLGSDVAYETFTSEAGASGSFFKVYGNGNVEAENISGTLLQSTVNLSEDAIVVEDASSTSINFLVKGDGHVYAREIEVKTGAFPDYVFGEKYDLMSLSTLREYIAKEKHLPGVKSAEEVEREGIGLGELSRIQMEKIEELTLYILQLEERIKTLEND